MITESGNLLNGSFSNPFEDFNATQIDTERIVEYWCDPVVKNQKELLSTPSFYSNRMPVIIQGSRGSGKTMLFKYYSYAAQKKVGKTKGNVIDYLHVCGGVGFYFRCDSSFINALKSVCNSLPIGEWEEIFSYYLDLHLARELIHFIIDLGEEKEIDIPVITNDLIKSIDKAYSIDNIETLPMFDRCLYSEIRNIQQFKDRNVFLNDPIRFCKKFSNERISELIIRSLKECFSDFCKINFVLMIDESESLPPELQRVFNTMIKYANDSIILRIGRRTEINLNTSTINSTEYLRLNHDYLLVDLDEKEDILKEKKYFFEVAQKRLSFFLNNDSVTIKSILGDEEQLVSECISVAKGRKEHIIQLLNTDTSIKVGMIESMCSIIECPQNPILEMINALWVVRDKSKNKKEVAKNVKRIMDDYLSKKNTPETAKYKNDYQNKYRYALTVVLCSIYKKNKLYYGFNTIVHLSNGNTRTFINLCREIIANALFYESDSFFEKMTISPKIQSKAIHKFSAGEFDDICSIIQNGERIRKLILNIGNTFALFHKDRKVRYPETNQFVSDLLTLESEGKDTLQMAQRWSMIIKKSTPQRLSVDINKRGDIFYINRVFSPLFNISYRVRGGFNVLIKPNELSTMCSEICTPQIVGKLLGNVEGKNISDMISIDEQQPSLFDEDFENE